MFNIFIYGLEDAFLPYGLVSLVVFYCVLSRYSFNRKQFVYNALLILLLFFLIEFFFILGVIDSILVTDWYIKANKVFYLLVAALFIVSGWINIRDWWKIKSQEGKLTFLIRSFNIKQPEELVKYFFDFTSSVNKWRELKIVFIVCICLFFSCVWQEEIVYGLFSSFAAHQNRRSVLHILSYLGGQGVVLLGVVSLAWILHTVRLNSVLISVIKILSAAVLLSVGLGVLYLNFNLK